MKPRFSQFYRTSRVVCFWLFLFLISTEATLFSQEDYATGYVILEQNDTIYGFIDQKSFKTSSNLCVFKGSHDEKPVEYTPEDIKGYQITNGKCYVAKTIPEGKDSSHVFLEYLVDGIANLYFIRDSDKDKYFIEKPGKGLIELTIEEKELYQNGKKVIKTNNIYKGVLRYTFSDDQKLFDKIDIASLSAKDLVRITKDYHNDVCSDYKCIDYTRDLSSSFSYAPEAGVIFSWMTMKTSHDFTRNLKPIYGIRFNLQPAFFSKRWSLESGIFESTNHFKEILIRSNFFNRTFKLNT